MPSRELARSAAVTVERLGLGASERFVAVSNPEQAPIAAAIAAAARERSGQVLEVVFATLSRHGEEPPAEVAAALAEADAAVLVTVFSLSHTRARLEATRGGTRVASMPDMTVGMFERTLPVDYAQLESVGRALAAELSAAERCRLRSPAGTDVELVLRGRAGRSSRCGTLCSPRPGSAGRRIGRARIRHLGEDAHGRAQPAIVRERGFVEQQVWKCAGSCSGADWLH